MSTADFVEGEAEAYRYRGQKLISEIELAERDLVTMRTHRDDLFRQAAEMTTAANILRDVGLRSEMTPNGPFVAVDYVPKRPDDDAAQKGTVATSDDGQSLSTHGRRADEVYHP